MPHHLTPQPKRLGCNITFCTHLLFCSKNLERIGDHTTNIAETVVYLVTGETFPGERPKGRGVNYVEEAGEGAQ